MSKRDENTLLNDLAPVNDYIKLMTSVVAVQMVDHTEAERNTRQVEVSLALLVNDNLFQKLAVDFSVVFVHSGGFVHSLYVVPYSVQAAFGGLRRRFGFPLSSRSSARFRYHKTRTAS